LVNEFGYANHWCFFAGSGREDIVDGEPDMAAFAQSSGLSVGKGMLYVADSEISAV